MQEFDDLVKRFNEWMPGIVEDDVLGFLKRRYANVLVSEPDTRDHVHYDKDPKEHWWDKYVGLIENQGNKPRCVMQSLEVGARVHTNRKRGIDCYTPNSGVTMVNYDAQALFDTVAGPTSQGMTLKAGLQGLKNLGLTEISPNSGDVYKCNEYWICRNRKEVLNDIATIGPVAIVVKWYLSFVFGDGVLIPKKNDTFIGYHAMSLTDAEKGVNSHGIGWGKKDGWFTLPESQWDELVMESRCFK